MKYKKLPKGSFLWYTINMKNSHFFKLLCGFIGLIALGMISLLYIDNQDSTRSTAQVSESQ